MNVTCKIPGIEIIGPEDPILPPAFVYPPGGSVFRNNSGDAIIASCIKYEYEDGSAINSLGNPNILPGDCVIFRSENLGMRVTTLAKMAIPISPPPPPKTIEQIQHEIMENYLADHPAVKRPDLKIVTGRTEHSGFVTTRNGKPQYQGAVVAIEVVWMLFDDHTFCGARTEGEKLQLEAKYRREILVEIQEAPDQQQIILDFQREARDLEQEMAVRGVDFRRQLDAAPDRRKFVQEYHPPPPKAALGREAAYWNQLREVLHQLTILGRPEQLAPYINSQIHLNDRMIIERIAPVGDPSVH